MWLGKLTVTPLGWLGHKTSTQTNKHLQLPFLTLYFIFVFRQTFKVKVPSVEFCNEVLYSDELNYPSSRIQTQHLVMQRSAYFSATYILLWHQIWGEIRQYNIQWTLVTMTYLFPKTLPLKWICCCKEYSISILICKKGFVLLLFSHKHMFWIFVRITSLRGFKQISISYVSLKY